MTRSRSNQGRSRRGRDRSGGQGRPPADTQVQEAPPVESQQPESQPRRRGGPPLNDQRQAEDSPRDNRARQADPVRGNAGEGSSSGPRPAGRSGRRRQQRRPQVAPIPGDVLRRHVAVAPVIEPLAMRQLQPDVPGEPQLGCPMLTRTRIGLPVTGGRPAPRCSLAWALHSEEEVSFCLDTPDLTQCWKAHPERVNEIRERRAELIAD